MIKVDGGYMPFSSANDASTWRNQKRDGGRVKKEMGKVEGKMAKMRLDRPGRKMGGRVGADKSPLSSAAGGDSPSDQSHSDECD